MQKLSLGMLAAVSAGGSQDGVSVSANGGIPVVGSNKVVRDDQAYTSGSTGRGHGHEGGRSSGKSRSPAAKAGNGSVNKRP